MELKFYNSEDGIHFPELGLWLDSRKGAKEEEIVFVSHAHADHISRHRRVVLTPATARLMQVRSHLKRNEWRLDFFKSEEFKFKNRSFKLTLLPAGHILGSAMLLIEAYGTSILYTGDFKLSGSLTAEKCFPRRADYLIMETTFGKPNYIFPSPEIVESEIIAFCRQTLSEKKTPILFCYSLGKSQDILTMLSKTNLPVAVHKQIHKINAVYREFGFKFPNIEEFSYRKCKDRIVIFPLSVRSKAIQIFKTRPFKTAAITGWAIDKNATFRLGVDAAFPLSNHSDFNELINFVKIVNPKKVFTIHGFAIDFTMTLNRLGYCAEALEKSGQKWLPLDGWTG